MNRSDEILWISQVVLLNDKQAFGKLMQRYHCRVRRYFLALTNGDRALSDDLAQTTFIRAWQGMNGFKMLSSFSTWLYRIAYTTWCNHLSHAKNNLSLNDAAIADAVGCVPDEPPPNDDKREHLRRAVASLAEAERNCITLFYLEEQSIKDIEKITGYKQGTIKSHLHRGKEKMANYLKQNGYGR